MVSCSSNYLVSTNGVIILYRIFWIILKIVHIILNNGVRVGYRQQGLILFVMNRKINSESINPVIMEF